MTVRVLLLGLAAEATACGALALSGEWDALLVVAAAVGFGILWIAGACVPLATIRQLWK